ncbi:MAG: type II toxin-antitoxin system VapB family antitoxin [Sphingomonas sp.]
MASLYIKDAQTNALAKELAKRRGLTKTAAVRMAIEHELARDQSPPVPIRNSRALIEEIWREGGWTKPNGPPADKEFFDSLYDE